MSVNAKNGSNGRANREEIFEMWNDLKSEVKRSLRIEDAVRAMTNAKLIRKGQTFEACCPFHMERTPSFTVDPRRGTYRCWGAGCNARGDVFNLIQDVSGVSFSEAIIIGADKAGVMVPEELRKSSPKGPSKKSSARKVVNYPKTTVRAAPAPAESARFIPVPDDMRRPAANRPFRMWQDGGQFQTRDPDEKTYRPAMVHEYRSVAGELLMSVLRIERPDKKYFIPARLDVPRNKCPSYLLEKPIDAGDTPLAWVVMGPRVEEPKPIYGMEDVREWLARGGSNVLLVEGEKTRDAARRLISKSEDAASWLILSPMGGANSAIHADWAPFFNEVRERDINVVIWPDADKPITRPDGTSEDRIEIYVRQTFSTFAQRAIDFGMKGALRMSAVIPPADVVSGWDLADAESENWSPEKVVTFIAENTRTIAPDMLELRGNDPETKEEEPMAGPFDASAAAAEQLEASDDSYWLDTIDGFESDDAAGPGAEVMQLDAATAPVELAEEIDPASDFDFEDPDMPDERYDPMRNQYFRCLGYHRTAGNVFMSLTSKQIFEFNASAMKPANLMHLAPRDWWLEAFPKPDKKGNVNMVNWEAAIDALIAGSYRAGVWEPERICYQGAKIDGGHVVFHTGSMLHVQDQGLVPIEEFSGEFCYAIGSRARTPEFHDYFGADAPEVREYLNIIRSLDWRAERRDLAIMGLFGWVAISVICGILKWRPHLWLDGASGTGKSWIVGHLIQPVLGDYSLKVLANSSEPGIRNKLAGRAIPVVFDEAEGETRDNRDRMDAIIRMARHSAVENDAVVLQGVSGGGASREHSIASTFLMTSIVPQLAQAADQSRFARLQLSHGRNYQDFAREIEMPAFKLLTQKFSDRWVGRMITRASDYHETYIHMVHGLSLLGLSRRIADLYGTFATGCWLMLRDGTPENEREAALFLSQEFNVIEQILDFNEEVTSNKDHDRLFSEIVAYEVKLDGRNNAGTRSELMGAIIAVACGYDGDEGLLSATEAQEILLRHGMRPSIGENANIGEDAPTHMLIHKNAAPIRAILEKTSYARSYPDVMHQAEGVKMGKPQRFGLALGSSRSIVVPLKYFGIEE